METYATVGAENHMGLVPNRTVGSAPAEVWDALIAARNLRNMPEEEKNRVVLINDPNFDDGNHQWQ